MRCSRSQKIVTGLLYVRRGCAHGGRLVHAAMRLRTYCAWPRSRRTAIAQTVDVDVQIVLEQDVVTPEFVRGNLLRTDCYFDEPRGAADVVGGFLDTQTTTVS